MPMSWNFGLRTGKSTTPAISSPAISCLTWRLSDPRQVRGGPRRFDPPAHGGGVSRQGDPDRGDRMAERGADARRGAAVADQPGARGLGNPVARQAGELSRQPDRGLRPALEA